MLGFPIADRHLMFEYTSLGLVDLGYEKHYTVIHSDNEFVLGKQHINGIYSLGSYCKRRLAKF